MAFVGKDGKAVATMMAHVDSSDLRVGTATHDLSTEPDPRIEPRGRCYPKSNSAGNPFDLR
jgi:hypothetical protein